MKPIWAIDHIAFQTFMRGMMLELKAGLADDHPHVKLFGQAPAKTITAGAIEDARRAGLPVIREGNTAIVSLSGPMMKNAGWLKFYGFADTREVRAAVRSAVADDEVDQIMLRIDSPGGEVDGTAELAEDVRKAGKIKRVIAQSDGMIASAAYWVASQASAIYAGRMDWIGSIGVRTLIYDFSAMFEEAGIRAVPIDTGPFKSAGAMGTPLTADQEAYFQGLVDDNFTEFRKAVQSGRGLADAQFEAVGDGRVFSTPDAVQLGLIDRIQTMDETIGNFRQQATRKARLALSLTA